jgi:hypothetical protein
VVKDYELLTTEERAAIMMKVNNCTARQIELTLRRAAFDHHPRVGAGERGESPVVKFCLVDRFR